MGYITIQINRDIRDHLLRICYGEKASISLLMETAMKANLLKISDLEKESTFFRRKIKNPMNILRVNIRMI